MAATLRALPISRVTQDAVLRAWETYRALVLTDAEDAANAALHSQATVEAHQRYLRLYSEWDGR